MKKYQIEGAVDDRMAEWIYKQQYKEQEGNSSENMLMQYEMNLPKLITTPQQRFADIAPINNAKQQSRFSPNYSYSSYVSKYLGDTVPLEIGLMQTNELNKQTYDSIAPTIKVGEALKKDIKTRDELNKTYEDKIKQLSGNQKLSPRQRMQQIKEIRTDYHNDEKKRAIETSVRTRRALESEYKDMVTKGKTTNESAETMLSYWDDQYQGVVESPLGGYNTYSGQSLAEDQDLVKYANSILSGWAASTYGSGSKIDKVNGMFIVTEGSTGKTTKLTAQEVQPHITNMFYSDPKIRADIRQRATVDATRMGDTSPENIQKIQQQYFDAAIGFATEKSTFNDVQNSYEFGLKDNPNARWAIDRQERLVKEAAEIKPITVESGLAKNKDKIPETLDKNSPAQKKAVEEAVNKIFAEDKKNGSFAKWSKDRSTKHSGILLADLSDEELYKQKLTIEFYNSNPNVSYKAAVDDIAKTDELMVRIRMEENRRKGEEETNSWGVDIKLNDEDIAKIAYKRWVQMKNNSNQTYNRSEVMPTGAASQEIIRKLVTREFDERTINDNSGRTFGNYLNEEFASISVKDKTTGMYRAAKNPEEVREAVQGVRFNKYTNNYELITNGENGSNVFAFPAHASKAAENQIFVDAYGVAETGKSRPSVIQIGNSKTNVNIQPTFVTGSDGKEYIKSTVRLSATAYSPQIINNKLHIFYETVPGLNATSRAMLVQNAKTNGIPIEHIELSNAEWRTTGGAFVTGTDLQGDIKATYNHTQK